MRAGSIEMEKKERGGGGGGEGEVSKLVFYARSTGTVTSGRLGGGGGGCRVLRELITTVLMKVSWALDS